MSVGGFWLKYTIFYLSRVNSPIISLFCQICQKIVSVNRAGGGWLRLSPYWSCRGQIDPVYSDAGRARRTISGCVKRVESGRTKTVGGGDISRQEPRVEQRRVSDQWVSHPKLSAVTRKTFMSSVCVQDIIHVAIQ